MRELGGVREGYETNGERYTERGWDAGTGGMYVNLVVRPLVTEETGIG
jgi:hypothetical protein